MEYGAFASAGWKGSGAWRVPPEYLLNFATRGGVVVVDGLDASKVKPSAEWEGIWRLFRCWPYPNEGPSRWQVPYIRDSVSNAGHDMEIVCRPSRILFSEWLDPCFENISQVVAVAPIALQPDDGILCSSESTSNILENDIYISEQRPVPWASVSQRGHGYLALFGATVTLDLIVREHPDNLRWALNIASFLESEADRSASLATTAEPVPRTTIPPQATEVLRGQGESEAVEFKEVVFASTQMKHEVAQAVAALANTDGGTLLIGVRDDHTIAGVEPEMGAASDAVDAYQRRLIDVVASKIGRADAALMRIRFELLDGHLVCRVDVRRADRPVWIHGPNNRNAIFIRIGSTSQELDPREIPQYLALRFPGVSH